MFRKEDSNANRMSLLVVVLSRGINFLSGTFQGSNKLESRPDWSLLWVQFKFPTSISDLFTWESRLGINARYFSLKCLQEILKKNNKNFSNQFISQLLENIPRIITQISLVTKKNNRVYSARSFSFYLLLHLP